MTIENKPFQFAPIFSTMVGLWLGLLSFSLSANTLLLQEIPQPLRPWIPWVLHDFQDHTCPFRYNQSFQFKEIGVCHWPSRLNLSINGTQAAFSQEWRVYSPGWIELPGGTKHWPQQVQVNDSEALVADREGIPSVFAPLGRLTIQGQLDWEQPPEYLSIPTHTGLVALTIDNEPVIIPPLDAQGRLWLRQGGTLADEEKADEDRLDMRVYRRIIDEIPLQLITRIELDVAGRHREVVLGPVRLEKHEVMSLNSPLPARLEADGRLRLQVRPGSWHLELRTRQEGKVDQLTLPPSSLESWVNKEIWVFEPRHELRLVELNGVTAIDPQQTTLPNEWRQFPAYQVQAGDTLEFTEKRRGDPDPAPDQLNLERHFWLDFDGKGYSIQDHISGMMTRGWRLEMTEPGVLGRVAVNGQDQFITRLAESNKMGVEVRRGQLDLVADSRLENALIELPAVGWADDFQQVSATLHLPPGWRLVNAIGVDHVPDTWLKQWTLLDLFIVLIMAAAIGKLWRWWWGGLALITMVLIYHEPLAPQWVWLNIIASVALLRVLPTLGWFSRVVRWYRDISLIALLILVLPFMMQQVRQSIYPQLERPWASLETGYSYGMPEDEVSYFNDIQEEDAVVEQRQSSPAFVEPTLETQQQAIVSKGMLLKKERYYKEPYEAAKPQQLAQIDPNAQVQTGPGLPQWEWRGFSMRWSGPVDQEQSINLWLLSPTVNSVLGSVRVVLLAILTVFLLWVSWGTGARSLLKKTTTPQMTPTTTTAATLLLVLGLLLPLVSSAETPNDDLTTKMKTEPVATEKENTFPHDSSHYPSQTLLNELQQRLLAPPDCLPHCASSPRLSLTIDQEQLSARMEIHSLMATAVPLPGIAKQWLPQQVLLNGEPAEGVLRDDNGQLWLNVSEGIHQVQLAGPLPNRNTVQLPLPLKPRFVTVQASKWHVEGLHENGVADDQLQFTRADETRLADLEMGSLPPFVQIERTLLLGLDWQVETRVIRLTPLGSPVVLKIPLLTGESVTSEEIRVEGNQALINLSAYDSQIRWLSVFDKQNTITLTAPDSHFSSEIWRLDTSAIWHVEIEGIPVVHHQDQQGRWLPEWRPWPGETVTLSLSRPEGVTGQVLTIDRSQLIVTPGQRTTESQLLLNLRSSRGGQHQITLPENAELQAVKIDDQSQPIRQEGRLVTLPITPGSQKVELRFRQPIGMTQFFQTSSVELGLDSVNTHIEIKMPDDRWILFVGGDPIGPAVMIWGILIVILLASMGLGQISLTPLKTHHWLLLGVVLTQIPVPLMLGVVAWFIALGWRAQLSSETPALKFNVIQLGLVILTLVALITLLLAIENGLLGHPNMHIAGNSSDSYQLRWYQDRTAGTLPQVWVFSWSMWIYRIAMLLWALWLSFALLRWLRWGWGCFSTHWLWKPLPLRKNLKVTGKEQ